MHGLTPALDTGSARRRLSRSPLLVAGLRSCLSGGQLPAVTVRTTGVAVLLGMVASIRPCGRTSLTRIPMPFLLPSRARASIAVIIALGLASACGGGGGGITVQPQASVSSVAVTPTSASLSVGGTTTLTASVVVSGGASNAVSWASSNPTVASLAAAGTVATVTGVSAGTATVTATSTVDGTKSASASITVTPNIATITITASASSLTIGGTLQVTAVARDAAGSVVSNAGFTWTSSATGVASVGATGLVTGIAAGTTIITARAGAVISNALSLTVTPPTTVVSWSPRQVVPSTYWKGTGTVYDFYSPGGTTVYAVTSSGYVGRWDGAAWSSVDQAAGPLWGISGSGASDIYAVGNDGLIRRFNGAAWSTMTSPTTNFLEDVWISSAQNGFAVGGSGTIVRLVAGTWSVMASGVSGNLWAVHGSSATNVFAVGSGGVILRFNGATWTQMASPTTSSLYGVWVFSPTSAVAVGSGGTILRFDGANWWTVSSGTTSSLYAVTGDAVTGSIVAVGNSGVALTSSATTLTSWTPTNPNFADDAMLGVWRNDAVGILAGFSQAGVLRRSPAGVWSVLTFAPTLNGAAAINASTSYAAGNFGAFAQFSGGIWQSQFATGGSYTYFGQMYAPTASVLYAVRYAGVHSYVAGAWLPLFEPGQTSWTGIGGTAANDIFAAGASGALARFVSSWSLASSNPLATTDMVRRVGGASGGPIFLVGTDGSGNGFLQRYSGGTWTRMALPTTAQMRDVSVVDANTAFAVGMSGTILRYNGASWSTMSSGTSVRLSGIWAASANEAYAVGDGGTVLKFNGTSWTPMSSGTTFNLFAVTGISGSYAIAVGEGMTIVTGRPTAAATVASIRAGSARMPTLRDRREGVTVAPDAPARRQGFPGIRTRPERP